KYVIDLIWIIRTTSSNYFSACFFCYIRVDFRVWIRHCKYNWVLAIDSTISFVNKSATETPINTSESLITSFNEPSTLSLFVHLATNDFVSFIPLERPSYIAPFESHIIISLTPYEYSN